MEVQTILHQNFCVRRPLCSLCYTDIQLNIRMVCVVWVNGYSLFELEYLYYQKAMASMLLIFEDLLNVYLKSQDPVVHEGRINL